MAGHSKWANIKHRKSAQDSRRGKLFTRLIREISVAAKHGSTNPADNPRLRGAIDKANLANVPRATIERAIHRADTDSDKLEEAIYEGYAAGGIAVLVEIITDNRNRTVAQLRHAFSKGGGQLATEGAVSYLFDRVGHLVFDSAVVTDELLEVVLSLPLQDEDKVDIEVNDDQIDLFLSVTDLNSVEAALNKANIVPLEVQITLRANTISDVAGEQAEDLLHFLEELENLDDVQNVHCVANFLLLTGQ